MVARLPLESLGVLETTGFTPALVALDVMDKRAGVQLVQLELNDFLGVCLKVTGSMASVTEAIAAGYRVAEQMGGSPVANVIGRPDARAWPAIESPAEFNPLIQQAVVVTPVPLWEAFPLWEAKSDDKEREEAAVPASSNFALGLIETQGFTAVFEAIDSACKAANVEVVGKEKLGGGYVTVIIKGDVAAVKAAVEAGREKVEGLGTLIAAHVIARPSAAALCLLPKLSPA